MESVKEMGTIEYAKLRKVSPVAVTRAMNKRKPLIGVSWYGKFGRDWILHVNVNTAKKGKKNLVILK